MSRDLALPVLLLLLAAAVLPSAGLLDLPLLPRTPLGFLCLAALLVGLFLLGSLPWLARRVPVLRPVGLAVAASPFVLYGLLEAPAAGGAALLPAAGWLLLPAAALLLRPTRAGLAAGTLLLGALGGDVVMATAGLPLLPAALNPVRSPVWTPSPEASSESGEATLPGLAGLRPGAPVPVRPAPPTLWEGPGPWYEPARSGLLPRDGPVVLLLDGQDGRTVPEPGPAVFVPGSRMPLGPPWELDAFDAAVVLSGAWPAQDAAASRRADALISFARRGGLLVGPAPERSWPEPLGRRLGAAGGADRTGLDGAREHGLGTVVRASSEAEIRQVLAEGPWRQSRGTAFDGIAPPPPVVPALRPWRDDPASRRAQGVLLLAYALVAAGLDRVLRGTWPRLLGVLVPALALALGLVWTSPRDPGLRVHGVSLDLGGGGGRRVEAVQLSAGPGGWVGTVRWRGGGIVRLLGARVGTDGRVRIRPRRSAWAVREALGRGGHEGERPDPRAAFLRRLLRGPFDPARLRFGRVARLPVHVEGMGTVPAWTLTWR